MIKIFEIITSITLGGAENLTFNLIDQCSLLHPGKFEFIVIELYATDSFYSLRKKVELRRKGIRVITLGGTRKRFSLPIAPFTLLKHIKTERPAVIHSHTDLPDFVLAIVLFITNLKTITIVRTIHNTELWSEYYLVGKFVESCFKEDKIIGVSEAAIIAYRNMRVKYKLPVSSQNKVIYNGCSVPKKEIHHFAIDRNKINIAFCGRFVFQKGVDILVETIDALEESVKNQILFHFIGNGTYRELVLKLAERNKNILVYNPVSNLAGKIYDFNFLIMPSRFEGLGLISIESSLSGVPVIAARAPGLDETLPADWPLFFNLHIPNDLTFLLGKIANSDFKDEELKNIAFNFVSDKFSMEEMITSYSDIYLE